MLGHATEYFTGDVYGHFSTQMRRDQANKIQSYYDNMDIS